MALKGLPVCAKCIYFSFKLVAFGSLFHRCALTSTHFLLFIVHKLPEVGHNSITINAKLDSSRSQGSDWKRNFMTEFTRAEI